MSMWVVWLALGIACALLNAQVCSRETTTIREGLVAAFFVLVGSGMIAISVGRMVAA